MYADPKMVYSSLRSIYFIGVQWLLIYLAPLTFDMQPSTLFTDDLTDDLSETFTSKPSVH